MPTAKFRTGPKDESQLKGSVTFDCLFVQCFLPFSVLSFAVLQLAVLKLSGRFISSSLWPEAAHFKIGQMLEGRANNLAPGEQIIWRRGEDILVKGGLCMECCPP